MCFLTARKNKLCKLIGLQKSSTNSSTKKLECTTFVQWHQADSETDFKLDWSDNADGIILIMSINKSHPQYQWRIPAFPIDN